MSDTSAQAQPEAPLVVTEAQVRGAMQQMEQLHGRGDGISISREVACLADLLGEMWFAREGEAQVPSGSKVGRLLLQAGVVHQPQAANQVEEGEAASEADQQRPV